MGLMEPRVMIIVGMVRICSDQRGVRKRKAWGLEEEDDTA
jgi:hypothetical protein